MNSTPDFATIDNLLSNERDNKLSRYRDKSQLSKVRDKSQLSNERDKELATVRKDKGSGNKPTQQRKQKQKQPVKANK